MNTLDLSKIEFDPQGLVPVIVQDNSSQRVIMFAWMNREALHNTLETGEMVFYSRSRRELWHKGATSGNTQKVVNLELDCDSDVILAQVIPSGPACHTGSVSCFDTHTSGVTH